MPESPRIEGLAELIRKVETLQQMTAVQGALLEGGALVKTGMQQYPPQAHLSRKAVYGQSFQTDRQRKFFFYALKHGLIQVPYRRGQSPGSRNLKQQWSVIASNGGLTVEIGNVTPYGPLVQGSELQTGFARATGWQTDKQVLDREGPAVVGLVKESIDEQLAG